MWIRAGLRSAVWVCGSEDEAEDFEARVAPLQDELVDVQRKKK